MCMYVRLAALCALKLHTSHHQRQTTHNPPHNLHSPINEFPKNVTNELTHLKFIYNSNIYMICEL